MKRLRPVLIIAAIAVLGLLVWLLFLRGDATRTLTGYVEGERIYLAAPVSGAVAELYVREGERAAQIMKLIIARECAGRIAVQYAKNKE